jgi:hypothetical protein
VAALRSLRLAWVVAALLAAAVVAQELRWQLHAPFSLAGLSHAVGVPVDVTLTAGFALRNDSRLPLEIERLSLRGDQQRAGGEMVFLSTTELALLRGVAEGEAVPAMPGTLLERGLRGGEPVGQRVAPGESIELGASLVGDGAGEYGLGPFEIDYRWGPFRGSQEVPLPRDYRVRVTAIDGRSP